MLLLDLDDDLLIKIFSSTECTMCLQRGQACRSLRALLRKRPATASMWACARLTVPVIGEDGVTRLTAADAMRRAPAGARLLIRTGTVIPENVELLHPLEIVAEPHVALHGCLRLQGGSLFAGNGSAGLVRGIQFRHYRDEAVVAVRPLLRTCPPERAHAPPIPPPPARLRDAPCAPAALSDNESTTPRRTAASGSCTTASSPAPVALARPPL